MKNKEIKIKVRVAGILVRNGGILLINHIKKGESYWVLPGGGIELCERARAGLEREFKEELGVKVKAGDLAFVDEVILPDGHHNIDLYFHCRAVGSFEHVKIEKGSAVSGYAFLKADKAAKMDVRPPLNHELVKILSRRSPSRLFFSY